MHSLNLLIGTVIILCADNRVSSDTETIVGQYPWASEYGASYNNPSGAPPPFSLILELSAPGSELQLQQKFYF